MKKTIISIITFILIILFVSITYFLLNIDVYISETVFFEFITTLTAIFGVVSILIQSRENHDLREAQFVVNLNKDYVSNKEYQKLLSFLENVKQEENFSADNFNLIANYFDFFEPIYLLIKKKIIEIEAIDDLFSYRFFSVVNNKQVQRQIICPYSSFYKNIIDLHYLWKQYRTKHHKDIPFSDTDLQLIEEYDNYCEHSSFVQLKKITETITIRDAVINDYKAIDSLYQILLHGVKLDFDTYKDALNKMNNEKYNKLYVATIDDKVVGTVQCTICASPAFNGRPHMVIDYFVVNKKFRRIGIGTELFKKIKSIAKENNVKSIFLVSSKSRKEAHKFYKSIKFKNDVKGYRMDLL